MHWRIVMLMMLFVALGHFNRISMTVAGAERLIHDNILSATEMGWVYASFLIAYACFMIPAGWLMDHFGPWRAWLVVGLGSAICTAGTGLVGWYCTASLPLLIGLLGVRCGFGYICAPLHPTAARLVGNWITPAATDLANGAINASACAGIAFTYVLFGMLIDRTGWQSGFLIMGLVTLLVTILWYFLGADRPSDVIPHAPAVPAHEPRQLGRLFRDGSMLCLTLSYGLLGYFQYLFFYWAEYYFSEELQLTKLESRWSASMLTLAMGAGMIVGGWLSDWTRRHFAGWWGMALVPIAGLVTAGSATLGALWAHQKYAVFYFAIAMAAAGFCEGAHWTCAVRIGRRYGGTAAAIMNAAGNGIGLLAPALTPWISKVFGWQASLGLAALVCWIAAIAWVGVRIPVHSPVSLPRLSTE